MKTFIEWCQHYEYDPESPAAKVDYLRYRDQLELFKDLLKEPCNSNSVKCWKACGAARSPQGEDTARLEGEADT